MARKPIDRLQGVELEALRKGGIALINRLDLSDRTLSAVALAVAFLALGFSFHSANMSRISERESRLAQEDLILLRGAIIANGIPIDLHQLRKEKRRESQDHH